MQYTPAKTANLSRNFFLRHLRFFTSPAFCTAFCYSTAKPKRIAKSSNPPSVLGYLAGERSRSAGRSFRRQGILRGNEPLSRSGRFFFCGFFSSPAKIAGRSLHRNWYGAKNVLFYVNSPTFNTPHLPNSLPKEIRIYSLRNLFFLIDFPYLSQVFFYFHIQTFLKEVHFLYLQMVKLLV